MKRQKVGELNGRLDGEPDGEAASPEEAGGE